MTKAEYDNLLEQAKGNGWDEGLALAAYFDARLGDEHKLKIMASCRAFPSPVPPGLCNMCGGLKPGADATGYTFVYPCKCKGK